MPGPTGHTIILCDARQAILYSMRDPPGLTIHYAMPCIVRPYHVLCHARQAIPYTMPCPSGHTTYHATPTRPYYITCQPGHTIYHAIPTRPYHIPYHARQVIPYTMQYYFGKSCHLSKVANGLVTRYTIACKV